MGVNSPFGSALLWSQLAAPAPACEVFGHDAELQVATAQDNVFAAVTSHRHAVPTPSTARAKRKSEQQRSDAAMCRPKHSVRRSQGSSPPPLVNLSSIDQSNNTQTDFTTSAAADQSQIVPTSVRAHTKRTLEQHYNMADLYPRRCTRQRPTLRPPSPNPTNPCRCGTRGCWCSGL